MDKLEVGMYVRTDKGIFRISHINISFDDNDYRKVLLTHNEKISFDSVEYIKTLKPQPSFNPIDLIEVGDYVNGHQVYEVDRVCCRITLNGGDIGSEAFRLTYLRPALGKNMGIKSIVTKEQFKNMEYRIGD